MSLLRPFSLTDYFFINQEYVSDACKLCSIIRRWQPITSTATCECQTHSQLDIWEGLWRVMTRWLQ